MKLLFIDACPRAMGESRTYALCEAFLKSVQENAPETKVRRLRLAQEKDLKPFDGERVRERDRLIHAEQWENPMFRWARELAETDLILIGAPYWDLSFPAALKIYIENIFVRELTFRYTSEGEPVGLLRGRKAAYITTAGSPIGREDWGAGYIQAVLQMLGVSEFLRISAEGLDIQGRDQAAVLEKAREDCQRAAQWMTADRLAFRRVRPEEGEKVLAMYKGLLGAPGCQWGPEYPGEQEIREDLAQEGLYGLFEGDALAASAALGPGEPEEAASFPPERGRCCYLSRVGVHRKYLRQGLGKRMVREMMREAERLGFGWMRLMVDREQFAAIPLYRKLGFEKVGEAELYGCHFYLEERKL